MSSCLSVYFLILFKTVLRGWWTFGFVGLKIAFWVLFVELGGLLTPFSVTSLFLATSHFVEILVASPRLAPLPSGLSISRYTVVSRITCNFLYNGLISVFKIKYKK